MPSKIRMQRISDRIRQELSEMLVKEVADPRLSGVNITDVKVDRELAWAEIFVSAIEGTDRSKEVLEGLRSAAGFLRHALAERVDLRTMPRLRFHWDPTPERADHIERVLAELRAEEEKRALENPERADPEDMPVDPEDMPDDMPVDPDDAPVEPETDEFEDE